VGDVMTRDFAFAFADASVDDVHARLSPTYRVLPILDSARRLVSFATRGAPAVDGVLSLDR
jgi:CBS-domain-containing membrane protein